MKVRKLLVAFLAALGVVGCLAWFLWPRHTKDSLLNLKLLRQTVEQGKQVVFFRVEGAESRRIRLTDFERVIGDKTEDHFHFSGTGSQFWAPSYRWPMRDPKKEFGVIALANAPIWKLRVTVWMETFSLTERFEQMPGAWKFIRKSGVPFFKEIRDSWNAVYWMGSEVIESESITNSVLNSP